MRGAACQLRNLGNAPVPMLLLQGTCTLQSPAVSAGALPAPVSSCPPPPRTPPPPHPPTPTLPTECKALCAPGSSPHQLLTGHLLCSLAQLRARACRPAPPGQQLQERRRPGECWRVQAWCRPALSLQEGLCLRHPPRTSPDAQALAPEEQGSLGGRGGSAALPGLGELRAVRGLQQSLGAWWRLLGCGGGTYPKAWLPHWLAGPRGKGPTTSPELCGSERLAPPAECGQEPRSPQHRPCSGAGEGTWPCCLVGGAASPCLTAGFLPQVNPGESRALVSEPAVFLIKFLLLNLFHRSPCPHGPLAS